tara:strand:- start:680 stop:808 length:129 start_codon:yes stop_codon:yes gene_type:complete
MTHIYERKLKRVHPAGKAMVDVTIGVLVSIVIVTLLALPLAL